MRLKKDDVSKSEHFGQLTTTALQDLPPNMSNFDVAASGKYLRQSLRPGHGLIPGKLQALDKLVNALYTTTDEKVVIVSGFTSTLDIIQGLCKARKYTYHRLDGDTPQKQRQGLVDQFNRQQRKESFVFLLSAKAGGVGINLIG